MEQLRSRIGSLPDFPAGERRVASFYLDSWPGSAFVNLAQASQASGSSTATVTRFVRRIGFSDFKHFSGWLAERARQDLELPQDRRAQGGSGIGHPLAASFARAADDLAASLASLDPVAFDRAVDLVADRDRPLYLAAVASGQPLMEHVGLLLGHLRGQVVVLDGVDRWPHQLSGLDGCGVLLAAAYDRDPLPLLKLLELGRETGATSIALTNRASSPLLQLADVALRTTTARGAMFGSRITTLAVLEAMVDAVAGRVGAGDQHSRAVERAFTALSIHPRATKPSRG